MNKKCFSKVMSGVAASMIIISGAAHADSFSGMTTSSTDVTFTAPATPLTLTLQSENPSSGIHEDLYEVASYKLTSTSNARIGVRFTPTAGVVGSTENRMVFSGKSNPAHKADLQIIAPSGNHVTVGSETFWVSNTDVTDFSGTIKTNGSQTIPADTYTVSMDAVVYNP